MRNSPSRAALRDIYPEHSGIMAPKVGDITIRQLVTHRSGMFSDDAFSWDGVAETNGPNLSQESAVNAA